MVAPTIPVIETQRLILRGPIPADVDAWAACIADPDVTRYVPKGQGTFHERAARVLNKVRERWEREPVGAMGWVITRKDNYQLIGWCEIDDLEEMNEGELGYYLGKPWWGQGYATEAARAMARYGLEHSKWERLVAAIVPANLASGRVLEHLGFVYEKHVDYREMTGVASIALDDPIVALYSLRRDQFRPGEAFYRLTAY
ncbi:MAG TPA: GNAT family N-acetyltransferase [Ktedonobacterales bacterium]|jgi:ribosomal-protein-alanine N-acetyltransferase